MSQGSEAERAALAEIARFPEMNPAPVLRLDLDGRVLLANTAAREVFGDELAGSMWPDLCPELDDVLWRGILDADAPIPVETEVDEHVYVFTHRRDFEGDLVFVFGADITDRRASEQLLAEFARFPDMNPGPVLRLDLEATVLRANVAAREVFGEELDGRCWKDVCPGLDDVLWRRIVAAQVPIPCETRVGEHDYVFTHRRDRQSELVFVFGADISEQKNAERALRQTEKMAALGKLSAGLAHELNNPAAAAGRAASQLEDRRDELMSATVDLARAGMDGDGWESLIGCLRAFRERVAETRILPPLEASDREEELGAWLAGQKVASAWEMAPTFVSFGLEVEDLADVASRLPSELVPGAITWLCKALEVSELAVTIARSSRAITELVGVVKSYSYMDQAPVQEVDVHQGLEDTLRILGHKLRRSDIEVVRRYGSELPLIRARGNELNQVWTNLVDNAIDAMDGKGTLTLRTGRDGDDVAVDVVDDGPGIPADIRARIFDPFFTTKEVGQGTGLGLDVVRRIVTERCHGAVDVESRPGETVVRVRIPIAGEGDG